VRRIFFFFLKSVKFRQIRIKTLKLIEIDKTRSELSSLVTSYWVIVGNGIVSLQAASRVVSPQLHEDLVTAVVVVVGPKIFSGMLPGRPVFPASWEMMENLSRRESALPLQMSLRYSHPLSTQLKIEQLGIKECNILCNRAPPPLSASCLSCLPLVSSTLILLAFHVSPLLLVV